MKNIIKRLTDNKYLVSVEKNSWSVDINKAMVFRKGEAIIARCDLFTTYQPNEVVIETT